jgi:hypothetical protein
MTCLPTWVTRMYMSESVKNKAIIMVTVGAETLMQLSDLLDMVKILDNMKEGLRK